MLLTREEAVSWFRKEWNYIADTIEREKRVMLITRLERDYCVENGFSDALAWSFLCEYTQFDCKQCPIKWRKIARSVMCEERGSLFHKCKNAKTWEEQASIARQIANLKEAKH